MRADLGHLVRTGDEDSLREPSSARAQALKRSRRKLFAAPVSASTASRGSRVAFWTIGVGVLDLGAWLARGAACGAPGEPHPLQHTLSGYAHTVGTASKFGMD